MDEEGEQERKPVTSKPMTAPPKRNNKKNDKKRLMMIIAVVVAVLVVGGGLAYMVMNKYGKTDETSGTGYGKKEGGGKYNMDKSLKNFF
jgi:flagellar basal body-associated protein FliL